MKFILDNTLVLTRSDLMREKKNKKLMDITRYDFNSSALSRDTMNKYDNILFCDSDYSTITLKEK